MTRFWTRGTVLAISVCLAVTAFPGKDVVLCIGSHGHVALEYAQNGRCDEGTCEPVGEIPHTPGIDRRDTDCGGCLSCVDIPFSLGPVARPSSASDGTKKGCCLSVQPAMLTARLAQKFFGGALCPSPATPGTGPSFCFAAPILRI